jgi:mannose-6-phosphate isomerase-like protein (cupin superfamily)
MMRTNISMDERPVFPGGIGLSRLRVYDTPAVDGLVGGTPHMHLCCTEGYLVLDGSGAVQTLATGGYAETALAPGTVAWFPPGTIHRLVNGGGLEIVVLMQNSGLPEAGDAVFPFPPPVLADPDRYAVAAAARDPRTHRARRDLAVEGFQQLREAVKRDGPGALDGFHATAAELVRPHLPRWRERWESGAYAAAKATGAQLAALAGKDPGYLRDGGIVALPDPAERGRFGMCGLLDTYHTG